MNRLKGTIITASDGEQSEIDESERIVTAAIMRAVASHAVAGVVDLDASVASASERDGEGNISSIIRSRRGAWSAEGIGNLLGVSKQHIYKLAKAGRMPSHRIGGAVRFDPQATADWWDNKATG